MFTRAIAPVVGVSDRQAVYDARAGVQSLHTSPSALSRPDSLPTRDLQMSRSGTPVADATPVTPAAPDLGVVIASSDFKSDQAELLQVGPVVVDEGYRTSRRGESIHCAPRGCNGR